MAPADPSSTVVPWIGAVRWTMRRHRRGRRLVESLMIDEAPTASPVEVTERPGPTAPMIPPIEDTETDADDPAEDADADRLGDDLTDDPPARPADGPQRADLTDALGDRSRASGARR